MPAREESGLGVNHVDIVISKFDQMQVKPAASQWAGDIEMFWRELRISMINILGHPDVDAKFSV